jgi:hypothetical protein
MSRLIVQAVSGESKFIDVAFQLSLFVSVTTDTGAPVSGLAIDNFRLCAPSGSLFGIGISSGAEANWNSGDSAGCYSLNVTISRDQKQKLEWIEGEYYPFGIQVQFNDEHNHPHMGQTVVRVQSLGK